MSSTEMGMLSMYPKFTLIVYFPIVYHHLHILFPDFEKCHTRTLLLIKFGPGQLAQLNEDPITIRFCITALKRHLVQLIVMVILLCIEIYFLTMMITCKELNCDESGQLRNCTNLPTVHKGNNPYRILKTSNHI